MKISEIIMDKYKLRIPPTVYYDLLADVREVEEEQEPTPKNDLGVDAVSRQAVIDIMQQKWGENFSGDSAMQESIDAIREMPSVTPQEPVLDKIRAQIEDYLRGVEITLDVLVENDPLRPKMEGAKDTLEECLNLIDKAETEG